jgi:hypothetical protein
MIFIHDEVTMLLLCGKSPFLTIHLLLQFDFGHRTSKPGIFDYAAFKTIHNCAII